DFPNTATARNDYAANLGYNPQLTIGDHAFFLVFESYYNPSGDGQVEWYAEYFSPDHLTNFRPFGFQVPVEGGAANQARIDFNASTIYFNAGYPTSAIQLSGAETLAIKSGAVSPGPISLQATRSDGQMILTVGDATYGTYFDN